MSGFTSPLHAAHLGISSANTASGGCNVSRDGEGRGEGERGEKGRRGRENLLRSSNQTPPCSPRNAPYQMSHAPQQGPQVVFLII